MTRMDAFLADSHGTRTTHCFAPTGKAERLADYFARYLFRGYRGSQHVRRVATWIGFLVKAIERLAGDSIARARKRQVQFEYRGRRFKARFNHHASRWGGIDILEVLSGRGEPDGQIVVRTTSLAEAEDTYLTLKDRLDAFIDG